MKSKQTAPKELNAKLPEFPRLVGVRLESPKFSQFNISSATLQTDPLATFLLKIAPQRVMVSPDPKSRGRGIKHDRYLVPIDTPEEEERSHPAPFQPSVALPIQNDDPSVV